MIIDENSDYSDGPDDDYCPGCGRIEVVEGHSGACPYLDEDYDLEVELEDDDPEDDGA